MFNGLDDVDGWEQSLVLARRRRDDAAKALREADADISEATVWLERAKRYRAEAIPVDRSAQQLVSGAPVPVDRSHTEIKDNGQQRDYVVLSPAERSKGFVRPYRDAYRHLKCGAITTMSREIAETYARDPHFYSGTFCTTCRSHYPVGEGGEFTWFEMDGREGPKVGT